MSDDGEHGRSCPWCSAVAPADATTCPACGAALAQHESIGNLIIPGVTTVDPALQAMDGQPIRLRGPSPTQGMANGVMVAAVIGGPIGLAMIGGVAAGAAVEYLSAGRNRKTGPDRLDDVGRPSPSTLLALERLEREASGDVAGDEATDPWRDEPRR
jgi:hypothetical protein